MFKLLLWFYLSLHYTYYIYCKTKYVILRGWDELGDRLRVGIIKKYLLGLMTSAILNESSLYICLKYFLIYDTNTENLTLPM